MSGFDARKLVDEMIERGGFFYSSPYARLDHEKIAEAAHRAGLLRGAEIARERKIGARIVYKSECEIREDEALEKAATAIEAEANKDAK